MSKSLSATLAIAIAAIAAFVLYSEKTSLISSSASKASAASVASPGTTVARNSGVEASLPAARSPLSAPLPTTKRVSVYEDFSRASDLKAFVDRIGRYPAAAEEKLVVARALLTCMNVAEKGSVAAVVGDFNDRLSKTNSSNNAVRSELFARLTDRCKGFAGDSITFEEIAILQRESAIGGSKIALAGALLDIERTAGREEAAASLRDILQSQDPIAIRDSFGYINHSNIISITGMSAEELSKVLAPAWTLMACDFGLECGSSSSVVTAYCVTLNQCGAESLEAVIQRQLDARGVRFQDVQALRAQLRAAIARGDWSALGLR